MTTRERPTAVADGPIELPRIELARSRARAQNVLFGDDATVRVGRYELRERIGSGGMGLVYRAFDPELRRSVALKVLRNRDESRLRGEATIQAAFRDPDVVQVFDAYSRDGVPFVAMELAEGVTLQEWLDERERDATEIIGAFLAAARVLARVHDAGVVHRDFKPENVIVQPDGARVRLLDFGVAVEAGASAGVAGTPGYMAPEVLAGARAHPRADQFAFCVSLADALADVTISRQLQRAVDRGRAARASARWPSMGPLIAALEREPKIRRRRMVGITLLALGGVVAAVMLPRPPMSAPCDVEETAASLKRSIDGRADLTTAAKSFLEADVSAWREAAERACDSNREPALACLRRHAVGLESLLRYETLGRSDWILAVSTLPSLETCSLEGSAAPPSRQREAVLARAEAALAARDHQQARTLAHEALDAADVDARTAGMARWILAEADMAQGRYESAREHYEDAAFLAARAGDDRVVVLSSCALVKVVQALGLGQSASEVWMRQARSAVARHPSPELETRVAIASGLHALALGDFEQARAEFDHGLEIAERAEGRAATSLYALHYQLGTALAERRHFDEARIHFEAAREGWAAALGDAAPIIGLAYKGLGDVARGRGRHAEAIEAYEQGRALFSDDSRFGSLEQATLEASLADALYRQGRDDEAKLAYMRAREILRGLNEHHRFLAAVEIGLGNLARDAGAWNDAYQSFRRARDLSVEVEGGRSMTTAIAESSAAHAALELGRPEEARALLHASIETRVSLVGEDAVSLAFPLTTLGTLQREDGQLERARATLERALELRRNARELDPRLLAETRFALAKAYADLEDLDAARDYANAARSGFDGPWAHAAEDVKMVEVWLETLGATADRRPVP